MEECRTGGTGGPSTSTCARVVSVSVCVLAPRCPRKAVTSSANPTSSGEVESHFESWWLTVNSSPSNTRPHPAVDPSFPARRGGRGGESEGYSARIATLLIAAYAGPARAGGSKPLQRPCGNRLQKLQRLVHPPLSPNPSPPPPGRKGELNSHIRPTLCVGWRSRADANLQTRREPCEPGPHCRCLRPL